MGPPFGVALPAGDNRMVNSLVGLGLVGGHHGHVVSDADLGGLGGLDGLHGLLAFVWLFASLNAFQRCKKVD